VENREYRVSIPRCLNRSLGIDIGLESFATLSTGEQIENPRFLRQSEDDLAKAQQRLSTKKRGSGKRRKQKKIVSRIHRKIQNQRKDHDHKLRNDLIERFDLIAVESLNVKGFRRSNLAKSISVVSWSTFIGILSYKAEEAGRKIVFVDPKYTSQDCSRCGHREAKELSERIHHCSRCGLVLHRDHNAAINILARPTPRLTIGISTYSAALGV
jgi:putative transposase